MKFLKIISRILSYILAATIGAAGMLLLVAQSGRIGKLQELEAVIGRYFIGEYDQAAIEDAAAAAMIAALNDRWSFYTPAGSYEAFVEQEENAYVGIGVTIRKIEGSSGLQVMTVEKNGGALSAGILPMDFIVGVDGLEIGEMSVDEVRDLIRGEPGSVVSLDILRGEERLRFDVQRKKIYSTVAEGTMLSDSIGLVTISNFNARCAEETICAIEALREEGAEAFILDVRNNPGGYASELIQLLDYLLPEGIIFHTEDYSGRTEIHRSDAACLNLPMAVLCNEDSYSAAEFFAAAMQEYEAAVIVGTQTCGKGYFQTTFEFTDGSAANISIGKYYTPKGKSLIDVGIEPDVVVEVSEEEAASIYMGIMEPEQDAQLQAALTLLTRNR